MCNSITPYGSLCKFLGVNTTSYIENAPVFLFTIKGSTADFPCSKDLGKKGTCYTSSLFSQYFLKARDEAFVLERYWQRLLYHAILKVAGWIVAPLMKGKTVFLSNMLMSTNLHSTQHSEEDWQKAFANLAARYPEDAVVVRNIMRIEEIDLMAVFERLGCLFLLSRQIWYWRSGFKKTKNLKRDRRLLGHTKYKVVRASELENIDYRRICYLYRKLYIEKYSMHGMRFTERFFQKAYECGFLDYVFLMKNGEIFAFLGFYTNEVMLTFPVVGYDFSVAREEGLYRLLSVVGMDIAEENNLILHDSSGVGSFKKLRGEKMTLEYNAIYTQHLPPYKRLFWRLTCNVLNTVLLRSFGKWLL